MSAMAKPGQHTGEIVVPKSVTTIAERASAGGVARATRLRANTAKRDRLAKERAKGALDEIGLANLSIQEAVTGSVTLDHLSVEQIAEAGVRRAANIFFLAGEPMLPTNPKECVELAKMWADIGVKYTAIRKGLEQPVDDEENPAKRAEAMLNVVVNRARKAKESGAG